MARKLAVFVLGLTAACIYTRSSLSQVGVAEMVLSLRSRVQPFKSSQNWEPVTVEGTFPVRGSAIIICDMWARHWCGGANARVAELPRHMNPVLVKARAAGVLIIHAPS